MYHTKLKKIILYIFIMYNRSLKVNTMIGGDSMTKVGIPRALLFYEYYPFWKTFFEKLGVEVILSDKTSKVILDEGVKRCVDEACLPVKIFFGHVVDLKDKVDYIFIPRLTSIAEKEYVCPKFGGVPDMIKNSIRDLPKIISTEINVRDSYDKVFKSIKEIGNYFTPNINKIIKAYKKATNSYLDFKHQFKKKQLPLWISEGKLLLQSSKFSYLNIGLLGHPYNLFDSYLNMNLLEKLSSNNINIIVPEMIDDEIINYYAFTLNKKMFWTFGRKIIGAGLYLLEKKDIHGIIYLMSFGCGVDSFICDMIERRAKVAGMPFAVFVLDEHTGEAGINTRLEAFIDMVKWRNKNENYFPTYG